jgi:hypothetical protein
VSALCVARLLVALCILALCPACAGVVERLRADLPKELRAVPVGAGVTASLNPRGTGLMLRISVPLERAPRHESRAGDEHREERVQRQQYKALTAGHVAL